MTSAPAACRASHRTPRSQVRPADADVDDGAKRLAGGATATARADGLRKSPHGRAGLFDQWRNGLAGGAVVGPVGGAQRHVQGRPALRRVDDGAREQRRPRRLHPGEAGEIEQKLQVGQRPRMLGEIQLQARGGQGQVGQTVRLGIEQARRPSAARGLGGLGEGRPGGVDGGQTEPLSRPSRTSRCSRRDASWPGPPAGQPSRRPEPR